MKIFEDFKTKAQLKEENKQLSEENEQLKAKNKQLKVNDESMREQYKRWMRRTEREVSQREEEVIKREIAIKEAIHIFGCDCLITPDEINLPEEVIKRKITLKMMDLIQDSIKYTVTDISSGGKMYYGYLTVVKDKMQENPTSSH